MMNDDIQIILIQLTGHHINKNNIKYPRLTNRFRSESFFVYNNISIIIKFKFNTIHYSDQ